MMMPPRHAPGSPGTYDASIGPYPIQGGLLAMNGSALPCSARYAIAYVSWSRSLSQTAAAPGTRRASFAPQRGDDSERPLGPVGMSRKRQGDVRLRTVLTGLLSGDLPSQVSVAPSLSYASIFGWWLKLRNAVPAVQCRRTAGCRTRGRAHDGPVPSHHGTSRAGPLSKPATGPS